VGVRGVLLRFENRKLEDLYTTGRGAEKYAEGVVDAFSSVLQIVDAAPASSDLYALKGLRVEKLKGKQGRRGERSLRLNDQYRLIFRLDSQGEEETFVVLRIEDYH